MFEMIAGTAEAAWHCRWILVFLAGMMGVAFIMERSGMFDEEEAG